MLAAQKLNNGPTFWALLLDDPDTVFALQPNAAALHALDTELAVAAIHPKAPALIGRASREARAFTSHDGSAIDPDIEVRVWFNTGTTMAEDPITGSLNASLAQWLIAEGLAPTHYLASQGESLGRAARIRIAQDSQAQVWVGGHAVTCIEGTVLM